MGWYELLREYASSNEYKTFFMDAGDQLRFHAPILFSVSTITISATIGIMVFILDKPRCSYQLISNIDVNLGNCVDRRKFLDGPKKVS